VKVTDCPKNEGLADEVTLAVVLALFTVCVKGAEVLELKLLSPPYSAVIECEPTDKEEVVKAATPPVRDPVPNVTVPSLNVTVPVGVPPVPDTLAVKVTGCPKEEGLTDEVSVVVEDARAVPTTLMLSNRLLPLVSVAPLTVTLSLKFGLLFAPAMLASVTVCAVKVVEVRPVIVEILVNVDPSRL
jgi:hypothetical protein